MKINSIISASLVLILAACGDRAYHDDLQGNDVAPAAMPSAERDMTTQSTPSDTGAADNSNRNAQDRHGANPTAADQSESEADLMITQRIRKEVMADDSLSTQAKNVKIITVNGVVTLRGPVETESERIAIASKSRVVTGVQRVYNQLEVAR